MLNILKGYIAIPHIYLLIFIQSQQFFGLDIIAGNVTNSSMLVFDFPPVFLRIVDHLVLRILIDLQIKLKLC